MRDELCGICFGGGYGDLRSCPGIHDAVCFSGDGASYHIDDSQCRDALLLCFTKGCQGIGGFSGLADDDDQIIFLQDRISVTEFTGEIHFYRNPCQSLHDVFCCHTCMISASAGYDMDAVDGANLLVGHAQFFDDDLSVFDPRI